MENKAPERKVLLREKDIFYVYDKRINKCICENCEGTVKYGLILKVIVSNGETMNSYECNKCHVKYTPYANYVRLSNPEELVIYNKDEVAARDRKRADDALKEELRNKKMISAKKPYEKNNNQNPKFKDNKYGKYKSFGKTDYDKKDFGKRDIDKRNFDKRDFEQRTYDKKGFETRNSDVKAFKDKNFNKGYKTISNNRNANGRDLSNKNTDNGHFYNKEYSKDSNKDYTGAHNRNISYATSANNKRSYDRKYTGIVNRQRSYE